MHNSLKQLGKHTPLPGSPDEAVLEAIPLPTGSPIRARTVIRFSVPEFTSLCPVTGQPDFARIYIDFVPKDFLVESKSAKLFMGSFRNHGEFHEGCTARIGTRFQEILKPYWIRVTAFWYPRGGIPIDVVWEPWAKSSIGPQPLPLRDLTFEGR